MIRCSFEITSTIVPSISTWFYRLKEMQINIINGEIGPISQFSYYPKFVSFLFVNVSDSFTETTEHAKETILYLFNPMS